MDGSRRLFRLRSSKLRQWVRLFAEAEPWEHALPRLVCMSVKGDLTAQELNEDFRKTLAS